METYGGVDVLIQVSLISTIVRSEWLESRSDRFTPGKSAPITHRFPSFDSPIVLHRYGFGRELYIGFLHQNLSTSFD
jgi:hypothetical protein